MTEEELIVDLEAIGEKYEEKGYFRRLIDMFSGLGKPHDTPEYKLARTELQRQTAPLIAIVSVVLFVVILIVVTAMTGNAKKGYEVKVQEQEEEQQLEEKQEEEPETPPDPEPQPMEDVDIPIDTPNPTPVTDVTPMPSPPSQQVSVKPAEADTVAFVNSPVKMKCMTGSRNPGSIGAATRGGAGYGDALTEATVLKVLWYFKAHQNPDGSWCSREGSQKCKISDTALVILTYLAHGEYEGSPSPYRKDFGPCVSAGLQFLINAMKQTGSGPKFEGADGHEYAFLIATYALCEAYGMTRNPGCKETAMVTLERIIKGQSATGSWDYNVNPQSTRDDLSFAGWALQALKAGKMAGMHPEGLDACIKKAVKGLKTRSWKKDHFVYCPASPANPGLTATGCLALQLLGFFSEKEVPASLEWMRDWEPTFEPGKLNPSGRNEGPNPQYYCYYATQCKYQAGMRPGATKSDEAVWHKWNALMKKLYPSAIKDLPDPVMDWTGKPHKQGYFACSKDHYNGDIMSSCLVALQLMVYYRYLPTTQTKATEAEKEEDGSMAADKNDVEIEVDI